jgi:hypothetical protein
LNHSSKRRALGRAAPGDALTRRRVAGRRVQRRCLETGRCISQKIVNLSVEMTPVAVRKLAPRADFVVVADSTESAPAPRSPARPARPRAPRDAGKLVKLDESLNERGEGTGITAGSSNSPISGGRGASRWPIRAVRRQPTPVLHARAGAARALCGDVGPAANAAVQVRRARRAGRSFCRRCSAAETSGRRTSC